MDQYFLREREGWLYVECVMPHFSQPKRSRLWWPTGMRLAELAQLLWSHEEAQARIGMQLRDVGRATFADERGMRYGLTQGSQTEATLVEEEDVPAPRQRGKPLPVEWRQGAWYKLTRTGWVLA